MKAVGSDLNPVAVLITKALIEIPPKFANKPPINPDANPMGMTVGKGRKSQKLPWRGAAGLAADIRYYGKWMREEAFKRIGHLYPTIKDENGNDRTVIAWLWCRTIPCSNPACGIDMPMMKTFQLSKKANNRYWTKPIIDRETNTISFKVQNHPTDVPTEATVNRNGATCIACNTSVRLDYVRQQAREGKMSEQMTAIVAEGDRKRLFISPTDDHMQTALSAEPEWKPTATLPEKALGFAVQNYGITNWHQLFTERQLLTLTTFSDLVFEVRSLIAQDSDSNDDYADAVCTYLTLAVGRVACHTSSFAIWHTSRETIGQVFGRQAISMIWDFSEVNPFSDSTGNHLGQINWIAKAVEHTPAESNPGKVHQADASTTVHANDGPIIVTDPPYYDNIGYADLSDFFYVWIRPILRDTYPELFAGMLTPKAEEMVAAPRFEEPRQHFEDGLNKTLKLIRQRCTDDYPSSIFYAYKQQEEERGGKTSTGWETMLNALIDSGFHIIGTWPMRTELTTALKTNLNALASSVILVCRPRPEDAPIVTRSQFLSKLKQELPDALDKLTSGTHIDPVDMPQAAIGPGMEIYSQYSQVIRNNGQPVPVREALIEINDAVATYFDEQQGSLDNETRLCLDWVTQHGFDKGPYGDVQNMARARNLAMNIVNDIQHLMTAQGGTVQLNPIQYFNPELKSSSRDTTAWEGCMRMAWHFSQEDGKRIPGAAEVAANMLNGNTDNVETLARILYDHYDRKNQPGNALIYNTLVHNMPDIRKAADEMQRANQTAII